MADNSKPEGVCPLSLLVFAANAHSQTEREEGNNAATSAAAAAAAAARLGGSQRSATKEPHKAAYNAEQLAQLELQEALQREALQRDALQQDALQQEALQRHALLSRLGLGNSGLGPQEQEYLQQLRLEALVQQRRQETLARLALTQEAGMSQEVQAIFQAQVLRQAAQLRQELLHGRGGAGLLEQLGALGGGRAGGTEENPLVQYIEEKARQERLAALPGGPVVSGVLGIGGDANFGADAVGSFCVQPAAEEQKQKEAAQDNLKTSVLPCRARGMPMDHNVKTAYFVVPDDIKHGTELVCSYYACRNAGIKFRYCTYCKLPVAKRNFCKRHKHTGKIAAEGLADDSDGDDLSTSENTRETKLAANESKGGPAQGSAGRDVKSPLKIEKEPKAKRKAPKKLDANQLIDQLLQRGVKELVVQTTDEDGPKKPFPSVQMEKLVEERKDAWEQLLHKRPKLATDKSIVSWAQQVLALSDFDATSDAEEAAEPMDVEQNKKDEKADLSIMDMEDAKPDEKEESPKVVANDAKPDEEMGDASNDTKETKPEQQQGEPKNDEKEAIVEKQEEAPKTDKKETKPDKQEASISNGSKEAKVDVQEESSRSLKEAKPDKEEDGTSNGAKEVKSDKEEKTSKNDVKEAKPNTQMDELKDGTKDAKPDKEEESSDNVNETKTGKQESEPKNDTEEAKPDKEEEKEVKPKEEKGSSKDAMDLKSGEEKGSSKHAKLEEEEDVEEEEESDSKSDYEDDDNEDASEDKEKQDISDEGSLSSDSDGSVDLRASKKKQE